MNLKQLLQQHYNVHSEELPEQREKSEWTTENNFGFLLGIITYGMSTHMTQLHNLLMNNQFKDQEQSFIESMFDYYIRPFHKCYNVASEYCPTSCRLSSSKDDCASEERELSHKDLTRAVLKRDGFCLFCWCRIQCYGVDIIAQRNISLPHEEPCLLQQAGLTEKHQVQNGLLLCGNCHYQFRKLKQYVDVVDDQLVIKVVNLADNETSEKYLKWKYTIEDLECMRQIRETRWMDSRQAIEPNDEAIQKYRKWEDAVESIKEVRRGKQKRFPEFNRESTEPNGEMALYFLLNDPAILPNRKALELHKRACLIWRMAGGLEPDDEYCSDEDDVGPVDTAALKSRFNIQD